MAKPDLVTFDCYGTLIDWRGGISSAFREHLPQSGGVDEDDLFTAFAAIENAVEAQAYRPYRQVLRETVEHLTERFGWDLDPSTSDFLANSVPAWEPFPDVNPALERLRSLGYRLGILSNIDDDLLADTLRRFHVTFDLVVTAEQTRSYKPSPHHFRRALEAVDGDPRRILHIAQSHYHDVRAAVPLLIPVLWVNRHGESLPKGGPDPTAQVRTLGRAIEWVEQHAAAAN